MQVAKGVYLPCVRIEDHQGKWPAELHDHLDLLRAEAFFLEAVVEAGVTKLVFTFFKGDQARKIEAANVGDAWISLSFQEDVEVEELVKRGWQVKFK